MNNLTAQGRRLIELGVPELAGVSPTDLDGEVARLTGAGPRSLLVVHPELVPPSRLVSLLERSGRRGFVVTDMDDVDEFAPIGEVEQPPGPLYLIDGVDRGDDLLNWSPAEALVEIAARGRRPLTINEGLSWLLQQPDQLEPGHCFMTIGSRKTKPNGNLDARSPAIWISGGTGRDGRARRGAPKVGWCWHNNRHTWLGFASCAR